MTTTAYKLEELSRRAGVSPRTVRYYVQRGLVPAPAFRGPDTAYGEEQLAALLAVKRLQEDFWPLEAIASAVAGRSVEELRSIGEGKLAPRKPGGHEEDPAPKRKGSGHASHAHREPGEVRAAKETRVRGERIAIARGVEIWVDEAAGDDERALVEELLRVARRASRDA